MNAKLKAIAAQAASNLMALVQDGEDNILTAWAACEEEGLLEEKNPKLKLAFGITLDLNANSVDYDLTFGIRRRLTVKATIPDPNQQELPMEETSVEDN